MVINEKIKISILHRIKMKRQAVTPAGIRASPETPQ